MNVILEKHALVAYTILCFTLSWGIIISYVGIDNIPAKNKQVDPEDDPTLPITG